ncbi:MAG: DMT family transporter [Alphaproteobacteria bacterium]|nr:DMT family transporter [Alphaproteobacteria bacterium]
MSGRDTLLMLMVTVLWAYNFFASKIGVDHFPPIFFSALRFALLLALMLPFIRPVPKSQRMALAGVALFMGVLHFALMFTGLQLASSVSAVAIATQTQVPFAALLAMLFLKERVGWRRWLGIAIAFAGVTLIGFDPQVIDNKLALLFVLGGALTFAINQVIASTIRDIDIFNMQAWIGLAATPGLLALSLVFEQGQLDSVRSAGWQPWAGLAYSTIAASIIGHGIMYSMVRRYPVSLIAPYLLLPPVLAVFIGVLQWGDPFTWKLAVGGAMTLSGVGIITLRAARLGRLKVKPDPQS